jgi:S-methylmethionine-dependent homocysteine/selenocysteine methylase
VSTGPTAGRGARHVVAGAAADERLPARPDPNDVRWFEPPHVRDPAAARERVAAQVAAGATAVVAPAWRTHRRALLPVGETRRARDWTAAAVRVAREGVEAGLERLASPGATGAPDGGPPWPGGQTSRDRADADARVPLVLGPLPPLGEEPDTGSGRLAPPELAAPRDYRDQAGLLADAVVDAILVEGQHSLREARMAVEAATDTGLPTWAVARIAPLTTRPTLPDGSDLEAWLEVARLAGVGVLGVRTALSADSAVGSQVAGLLAQAADIEHGAWGVLHPRGSTWPTGPTATPGVAAGADPAAPPGATRDPDARAGEDVSPPVADATRDDGTRQGRPPLEAWAEGWLAAGASLVGLESGATPDAVDALRRAMDRRDAAERAERDAATARWRAFVAEASRRAPGGFAVWVGDRGGTDLPGGFAWAQVPARDVPVLPRGHHRLVVVAPDDASVDGRPAGDRPALSLDALAGLLDEGGVLVLRDAAVAPGSSDRARLVALDEGGEPVHALYRRERR